MFALNKPDSPNSYFVDSACKGYLEFERKKKKEKRDPTPYAPFRKQESGNHRGFNPSDPSMFFSFGRRDRKSTL